MMATIISVISAINEPKMYGLLIIDRGFYTISIFHISTFDQFW